jgi:hypothetical protein
VPSPELFPRATTPDVNVIGLEDSDKQLLPQFVKMAHDHVCPFPPLFRFPNSGCVRMLVQSCPLEGGPALDTFLLPLPLPKIALHLLMRLWELSHSTI